jgi:hypothetical protein
MTNLKTPPPVIYLLDYGSPECTWCEDPSPSGEDHSPVRYVREDWKAIAEQLAEILGVILSDEEVALSRPDHVAAHDAITLFQQAKDAE